MKHLLEKMDKGSESHSDSAQAKLAVLEELRNMAMEMMGDKVRDRLPKKEMHSVEVAAPDREGLEAGLDMAKSALPMAESTSEEAEEEQMHPGLHEAVSSEEMSDEDEMSDEELDEMIAELQAKRAERARR